MTVGAHQILLKDQQVQNKYPLTFHYLWQRPVIQHMVNGGLRSEPLAFTTGW